MDSDMQQRLEDAMDASFSREEELGASVVVWGPEGIRAEVHRGYMGRARERKWNVDSLVPVYSATKGVAALSLLRVMQQHGQSPQTLVGSLWPKFPLPKCTVEELLCHQTGVAWLDRKVDVFNYPEVIAAIEAQEPAWTPPEMGYHPRTWGFLVDELCRRMTGVSLGEYFNRELRTAEDIDFWIGLPAEEEKRVAELLTGKPNDSSRADPLYRALAIEGSEARRAFTSPQGLYSVSDMNTKEAHAGGFPALGGVGSARGLAQIYASLIDPQDEADRVVRSWIDASSVQGKDRILLRPIRFSLGFQRDPLDDDDHKLRTLYGPSHSAFGHPGAGGSHAFVDPEHGLAFAYVMNQMELSVLPGDRARRLVEAVYRK